MKKIREFVGKDITSFSILLKSVNIPLKEVYTENEIRLFIDYINRTESSRYTYIDYENFTEKNLPEKQSLEKRIKNRKYVN